MHGDITVVVPTIPPRAEQLRRALHSITEQTLTPAAIVVEVDRDHEGAAITRHRGLTKSTTEWTAFLDDDDTFDPNHLELLHSAVVDHHADYVWSRFRIGYTDGSTRDGPSPLGPGTFTQWNDNQPAQTTITTLVRTDLAQKVGGFAAWAEDPSKTIDGHTFGEDFDFTLRMRAGGAVFHHVPAVTWTWMHWGYGTKDCPGNTSGQPNRW